MPSARTGPRILIVRLSAIGDVVVTTPVSRALREAFPDAYLAWVVEPAAAGMLGDNPYLDEVIVWDRKKGGLNLGDILRLRRRLKPKRFDWVIDCQGLLRSALVARLSGARTVVGNVGAKERADLFYHRKIARRTDDLSSRQRCLDLLRPLGVESRDRRMVLTVTPAEQSAAAALLRDLRSEGEGEYACLVPATTWPQKHWFDENWGELAALLREQLALDTVVLGGPRDAERAERIRSVAGARCFNAAGKTTLKTAAALLQGARVAIAVDTALMHAAVAVGTPTVGVCGASWWPGFSDYEGFSLVREPMECSPCLHRPTCDGRFDCMRALTAARVAAAARELLHA